MHTRNRLNYIINIGLAAIAGLSGCVAVLLTIGSLFLGLALDNSLQTSPSFTICCTIGSVPISLVVISVMVYRAAKAIEKRQYGSQ